MNGRVLVVDDEENVLVTIEAILKMDGYLIDTAQSGERALELLREHDYDVVLTDLRLEDMSGQDILMSIRETTPATVSVMLTGYASLETALAALREGAYDYLIKPSDPEELRATVRRGIERRQLLRRITRLEELDELKSQFLSIASHELRTPITAVSGFAQLAVRSLEERLRSDPPADPKWQADLERLVRQLNVIQDQSSKLGRLVRELLDVSRIQSGRLEFRLAPVDMTGLVNEVAEQMRLAAPACMIRVEANGSGPMVVGDRDHLEQVVGNLIDNAMKYSPAGADVTTKVSTVGEEARIVVEDRGIGIPQDQLSRVFDLFYRTAEAEARRTPGLGLGLYITRGIVERHGGRIWMESEPGKWTRATVALPVQGSPAGRKVEREQGGVRAETPT
ncbi:MAG: sensor histidine kinase [Candidatus Limnocylindria bacterium]